VKVEQFSEPVAFHGEGPVWWQGLRLVDMLAGDIVALDGDGAVAGRLHVGRVAAAFRPRRSGGFVVAVERGFALVDGDGAVEALPELWEDAGVRMNDGATDPHGRFYCGSMAYDMSAGAGAVYRLDAGGAVSVMLSSVTCSNGLAWSPDGATAYYVDSLTYRIDVFDYDESGLTARRPFVAVAADDGLPDGLTVDREGGVWVALFGGSAVRRYNADGKLDEVQGRGRRGHGCICGHAGESGKTRQATGGGTGRSGESTATRPGRKKAVASTDWRRRLCRFRFELPPASSPVCSLACSVPRAEPPMRRRTSRQPRRPAPAARRRLPRSRHVGS
jgi:sugar lactone lactonase YvrE